MGAIELANRSDLRKVVTHGVLIVEGDALYVETDLTPSGPFATLLRTSFGAAEQLREALGVSPDVEVLPEMARLALGRAKITVEFE